MNRASLEGMDLTLKESLIAFILAILPSGLKIGFLKLGGARIGKKVRIGIGTIIMADKFSKISIGDYTEIRNHTYIICKEVNIGKYVFIGMHVWIWGSGKLMIKNKVNIGSKSIIDIRCNNFYIGEYSGLGAGSIVYTHTHAWPYTHGWLHRLKDVVFEDHVMGALRIIVLPGVTVGKNSIIGAGAVVTRDIPPNSFAAGVPAKVVSSVDNFQHKIDSNELKKRTIEIAKDLVDYFGFNKISEEYVDDMYIITFECSKFLSKKKYRILVAEAVKLDPNKIESFSEGGKLILFSTSNVPSKVAQKIMVWFDVKNLQCGPLTCGFAENIWRFLWHTWAVICDEQLYPIATPVPPSASKEKLN